MARPLAARPRSPVRTGEQHPLEPARPAPPVVRRSPHRARRIDAEPIELLPPAWAPRRRTSRPFPWRAFPATAAAGVGLHYALQLHPLAFIAAACAGIMALTWWLLRWTGASDGADW